MVTDKQVLKYRKKLKSGYSREQAAMAVPMHLKTARYWEDGPLPSTVEKKPRSWRTRDDPLQAVWESKIVPRLQGDEKGVLQAKSLVDLFELDDSVLRTLQRRISEWRALNGPGKEVFFPQEYRPGQEAQLDFTHAEQLEVTIAGDPFPHLIFQVVLCYSKYRAISLSYAETTEALIDGIQDGFEDIGGVPAMVCLDNLSAASYELKRSGGREFTQRYKKLLEHLGLNGRRINAGESNENGVVERGHGVLKSALQQALALRQSSDFPTIAVYWAFVVGVKDRLNFQGRDKYEEEKAHLASLPTTRMPGYTDFDLSVGKFSCVQVSNNTYSVPSGLIGHDIKIRRHANELEVIFRGKVVERIPRLRGRNQHRINYRHIIGSLVRKPGAFPRYRFREDLFPSLTFRKAYDALIRYRGERADVDYVRILYLAANTMETNVEAALNLLLEADVAFEYGDVNALANPELRPRPEQLMVGEPLEPDLGSFDTLLMEETNASLIGQN